MSKLTLRAATDADRARAVEFRRSLKGWSQDNMFLALAIVYTDYLALQTIIHEQRKQLRELRGETAPPVKETTLIASVKRMALVPDQITLARIRAKPRSQ